MKINNNIFLRNLDLIQHKPCKMFMKNQVIAKYKLK